MRPTKKSGRILGVFFLTSIVLGVLGTTFRGLSGVDVQTVDFLNMVTDKVSEMKWAIGLDIMGSATMLLAALFLFPFLKALSSRLALGYFGLALINFVVIVVSNIIHTMLISLSGEFTPHSGISEVQAFVAMGKMLYDGYYWTHFLMLALYSIGNVILFYFLFKTRFVPKWLSVWGVLASVLVFSGGVLQLAEIEVSFLLFVQNGIFMLFFTAWLLIMGFDGKSTLARS